MGSCPESLSVLCGFLGQFVQTPPTGEQVVIFIMGALVVTFYAIDHYKVPTYAKTTVGDFIELAPQSLTSASRYRKGLFIYIGLILALYIFICVLGPNSFYAITAFFSESKKPAEIKPELWPMFAATAVTLLGAAGDKNPLGRLEAALRALAHESAYIPAAVANLSNDLEDSFELTREMVAAGGEDNPKLTKVVEAKQEGSLQTWWRAAYLFSRLEVLKADNHFRPLLTELETERALNFLREERDALLARVKAQTKDGVLELDQPLKKKIEDFRKATSVFLASILWRGAGTDVEINRKLQAFRINIPTGDHRSSWNLLLHVFTWLAVGYLALLTLFRTLEWAFHANVISLNWHLTLGFTALLFPAVLTIMRRERQLTAGKWKNQYEAYLRNVVFSGLPGGVLAAIVSYIVHQGGYPRFVGMLIVALPLAAAVGMLLPLIMNNAATSNPTEEAIQRGLSTQPGTWKDTLIPAGKIAAIYAGGAFFAAFLLFWFCQRVIVMGVPTLIADAAIESLAKFRTAHTASDTQDGWFRSAIGTTDIASLDRLLRQVKHDIAEGNITDQTVDGLKAYCETIHGKLPDDKKLIDPNCRIDESVTVTLRPDSEIFNEFKVLFFQLGNLLPTLQKVQTYNYMHHAIGSEWRRGVLVSLSWAFLAAILASSVYLFRRRMLWEDLETKLLRDYSRRFGDQTIQWLRHPLVELDNLTPLEAARYNRSRDSLSDMLSRSALPERELRVVA